MQGALQILGRECPSEVSIQAVIEKSRILSLLDDQIPEKEEWEEKAEADEEGGNEDDWRRRKRRRAEDAATGGHRDCGNPDVNLQGGKAAGWKVEVKVPNFTTAEQRLAAKMTTSERLAAAAAAGTAGFRSAGSHMEELKQKRLTCEADKERLAKRAHYDAMPAKAEVREQEPVDKRAVIRASKAGSKSTSVGGAKLNKRPVGQGSLMSYFAPKPPAPKEVKPKQKTATEVIRQTKGQSLKEQMEALPQPKWPVRPDNNGVVLLSSSPVRARTKRKERTPGPPSSPVFAEFCRSIEEEAGTDDVGGTDIETGPKIEAHSLVKTVARQSSTSSRTATNTTMAGLSSVSRSAQLQGPGAGIAKKRTLGIRRSMNGWQNRTSAKND